MDDDLIDVARTIRPYLPKLVGDAAPAVDQEIAALLAAARSGTDVGAQLDTVLGRTAATHDWKQRVLGDARHRPPELQPPAPVFDFRFRGIENLPGNGEEVDTYKYVCPKDGDYTWWRSAPWQEVPRCPDDGEQLVPADRPDR